MRSLALLIVAASLGGCVSTQSSLLGAPQAAAPVAPASVALYRTADQVGRPYAEVALLNSSGDSMWTTEAKMFESMRLEAARLGANGVILEPITEPSPGLKLAAAIFHVSAPRKGRALAIRTLPAQ